ncbi:hypothetical protein Emed_000102 [Eimeria media]
MGGERGPPQGVDEPLDGGPYIQQELACSIAVKEPAAAEEQQEQHSPDGRLPCSLEGGKGGPAAFSLLQQQQPSASYLPQGVPPDAPFTLASPGRGGPPRSSPLFLTSSNGSSSKSAAASAAAARGP